MQTKTRFFPTIALFLLMVAAGPLSFGQASAPKSEGLSHLSWTRFQDPLEHAFTIDVPQGWIAKGGMFRVGYSDYRPMLDLRSPDGYIQIRSGDVAIPTYTIPNQYHQREGEINDLGASGQSVYARYRSGRQFAQLYALTHFRTLCRTLAPQQNVDQSSPVIEPDVGPNSKTSAGTIAYNCDISGRSQVAYVYARTTVVPPYLWQATALISYIAPPDKIGLVRAILMHGSQSFRVNPAWLEYQKKMDAEGNRYQIARQRDRVQALGGQVQQFEARMHSMRNQVSAFQRQQNSQGSQVSSFGNVLTGVTPTIDPLSGETRDVWTGPRSGYWENGQGTIVNSDTSPGAGFHPLDPQ